MAVPRRAEASERALVRVLQSQIAMTPRGSYRSALETHLDYDAGSSMPSRLAKTYAAATVLMGAATDRL